MSTEASFSPTPDPRRGDAGRSVASDPPASPAPGGQPNEPQGHLAPGDQAAPGTPGTGEDVCPRCGGSGRAEGGGTCPGCEGTGTVTVGIGGG